MKQKHHTAEQIVGMLRQAEARMAQGQGMDQICKAFGVSEATYYRWRKSYGTMPLDHVKRLKHLEQENSRLKRVVADLTLDKAILQEALQGNY
jgi:putative transposase